MIIHTDVPAIARVGHNDFRPSMTGNGRVRGRFPISVTVRHWRSLVWPNGATGLHARPKYRCLEEPSAAPPVLGGARDSDICGRVRSRIGLAWRVARGCVSRRGQGSGSTPTRVGSSISTGRDRKVRRRADVGSQQISSGRSIVREAKDEVESHHGAGRGLLPVQRTKRDQCVCLHGRKQNGIL
jgi:hypothetical protein